MISEYIGPRNARVISFLKGLTGDTCDTMPDKKALNMAAAIEHIYYIRCIIKLHQFKSNQVKSINE